MSAAETKAFAIYQAIRAGSADRPFSGNTIYELTRAIGAWKEANPALVLLNEAPPEVHLAFLGKSFEWLKAEARVDRNFRVCHTLLDAIQIALRESPKPLPPEMVAQLLSDYRNDSGMPRMYFPLAQLLAALTRDQVTDEIRTQLRKLHLQFAPSPTGKIEEHTQEMRDTIAALMRLETDRDLDPGRGPWSQIVFDELLSKDAITRTGWETLLEHCRALEQTVPGAKWNKRTQELVGALGSGEVARTIRRWLALGPTPGQLPEARSPIEDSSYQKGIVWCLASSKDPQAPAAIADFGIACLRKIRMLGAVSQKVGFACVQALGAMEGSEPVSQLTRLRAKVKYSVARRLIEKSLQHAAQRNGLSVDDLEDISVRKYPLDPQGNTGVTVGNVTATIHLAETAGISVLWRNAAGKLVKSAPSDVKKAFPEEVRSVPQFARELEQAYLAQRLRLDASFIRTRTMPLQHWREYFIDHPLLGFLGRRLVWAFSDSHGWEQSAICFDGETRDSSGEIVSIDSADKVRLWHPLSSDSKEVQSWRQYVYTRGIRQPFRQAFREFYQVTDAERETKLYSNRFAGVLLRQHQFASLCRERGWTYRLMGTGFDGANVPAKKLDPWNMHAEFYVDLPADRVNPSSPDSPLTEKSGAGINLLLASDQVRFYHQGKEIAVDEVPAIVFSEVMRDVDLFTSVCAVGDDETWSDQGDRGLGIFRDGFDIHEFSAITAMRADILSRVLPHTPIAARCKLVKASLEVRGQLGTYRIQLAWGGAMLETESVRRWLRIPQKILNEVEFDLSALPIELDHRTEMILRKACVLANDWKISAPDLVKQLMPD